MRHLKSSLLSACAILIASSVPGFADDAPLPLGATQGSTLHSQQIAPDAGPSPYQLKLQYTGEAWDNAAGGVQTGTIYMQNVDAQMKVDTGKAFGWTGGKAFVEGYYNSSRSLDNNFVGAVQDASVIDTSGVTMFRLYQAYYDQDFASTGTDLLLGVYDIETEFGNTKPMNLFFNGAYAWTTTLDQSGFNGPSNYPNTSLAFRAHQQINKDWSVQGVIADGESDSVKNPGVNAFEFQRKYGAFMMGEADYEPTKYTKIMAGYWGYTGKFDNQNGDGQTYGSNGGYIGGATRLYELEGRRGLDGFANIGLADSQTNENTHSLNTGLTFTGPLDARPLGKVGLAMGIVGNGSDYREGQSADGTVVHKYETNFEGTYRAPITDWLTAQPDVQYWIHPGYDPTLKNDWLIGVHFEIGHLFNL